MVSSFRPTLGHAGHDAIHEQFQIHTPKGGDLEKTITTGPAMTWEAWCRLVAALEAKAELGEQNGLPATAKSWRSSTIENLIWGWLAWSLNGEKVSSASSCMTRRGLRPVGRKAGHSPQQTVWTGRPTCTIMSHDQQGRLSLEPQIMQGTLGRLGACLEFRLNGRLRSQHQT